ncbi:sigma-70 family RNA polymerase sigma factor [Okeania sp.]|uniref:RNA polymerase sigma factor n=1 Tax=Okeania sp. TaxID=3100323 RepID=UPI002B4B39ED|nr:sigma-70 family RNA polymerase sigma factor [Okeania sp.]MEB3343010.1 sigma-70 family RNA polymerase sigma factor [Okeania sp.]
MDFALTDRSNPDLVCQFWQQWTEHKDLLYVCCLRLMNFNHADAEDVLSQAMVKAWEKVQKFGDKIANFKAWLVQLTRNLCIDIIRRSRKARGVDTIEWVGDSNEMVMVSAVESPESRLEKEERSIETRRAITNLPERLRGTFILHFYEELTYKEIASRQGISYDNVCRRIYLARKELKKKLSSYFLGTEEKVSFTAGRGEKLSTPRKNKEKQQSIESEEKKEFEVGTKQLSGDRPKFDDHFISRSLEEADKSEFVDTSVGRGDNLSQTIRERETVLVEAEGDRVVEAEKLESAVESREQVDWEIQDTATELTEVEVVEVEKDGCVKSLVKSKDNRHLQKTNNFIRLSMGSTRKDSQKSLFVYYPISTKISTFLCVACCRATASKSSQKKAVVCCLSRDRTRWLRPYVMWWSLTGNNTKSGLISLLMGEMKLFLNVQSSLKNIRWIWHRSLMDTGG